jgi:hypothetical protein
VNPGAPAVQELIALIERGFLAAAATSMPAGSCRRSFAARAWRRRSGRGSSALGAGHPYLRLPLQFAASLRPRLEALISPAELATLLDADRGELARPDT